MKGGSYVDFSNQTAIPAWKYNQKILHPNAVRVCQCTTGHSE
jgi:hypothetical protein